MKKVPSPLVSLIPLVVLISLLFATIRTFGSDALSGGSQVVLLTASTVCSGIFLNLTTADQYTSIILTGNMFRNVYEEKGYESRLLSRTTEDSVTVTSVLVPWNTCSMTQATILSVPTLVYLPYCFFNIISPLMSITIAAIGYKIVKRK